MSAQREVLIGFAPADLLYRLSFADILNESSGKGYQRPFNKQHSLDFRRYIKEANSSTIPLTLNLRPSTQDQWEIIQGPNGQTRLEIAADAKNIMAQVDCQHRLGHLMDFPILLPFMCFIGLTEREEMEVFSVINSKAKGLSASLLDYHEAQLAADLSAERPELFIALQLNRHPESPWQGRLNLGGEPTPGLKRTASLRMMQKAVEDFLQETDILSSHSAEYATRVILDFWKAVVEVLPRQWEDHRKHLITKGIGLYSLMYVAADIFIENQQKKRQSDTASFAAAFADFAEYIDWSSKGTLKGYGGQAGVKVAVEDIRKIRKQAGFKVIHG
ncbi:DGQHR domain-containing protein [Lacibacterium aquatile]|uniref:DGQHR domain-containing protein n=1 Tax=Lacibacterium aquatile TaxID=1168082 RepID=A0ABW5DNY1_9PROT